MSNFGDYLSKGLKTHEDIKGRNSGQQVLPSKCSGVTNWYWKGGSYEQGGRTGACGSRKDHKRVYQCPDCAKRHWFTSKYKWVKNILSWWEVYN